MKNFLRQFINENYVQHQLLLRESDQPDSKNLILDKGNQYGIDGIDTSNFDLNSYEKSLIDRLMSAFFYSRKSNQLNLSIDTSSSPITKELMANIIVQPVKRVITFANLLSDFKRLNQNDQCLLIHSNCIDIFICSSSLLFDMNNNRIVNKINCSKEGEKLENDCLNVTLFIEMWGKELFEKTISYLKSINELNIDHTTLLLYLCVILFSQRKNDLIDKDKISQLNYKYSTLLKKYIYSKIGNHNNSNNLIEKLMLKLDELNELSALHRSFFSDIKDYGKMETIAKSILMDI